MTLADVTSMSTVGSSEWGVETEFRTTDAYNVMSEWATMDVIDPISEGNPDAWTSWQRFIMGDFTGRIFQFRLRLRSFVPTVSPRVFDAVIRSDMPDRLFELQNQLSNIGSVKSISISPAFKSLKEIRITQDAASSGDYYNITSKTASGFDIEFFDKNDNSVQRQFDVGVAGYGRLHNEVI